MMNEKYYLCNEEGEVIREVSPNEKLLSNGQTEYLLGTEKISYDFVKLNIEVIKDFGNLLKYIVKLLPYIELGTGILKYKNGLKIRTSKGFCRIFNIKEDRAEIVVRELKREDIIHKCKNKEDGMFFVFNPFIAHCSRRVPTTLYREFYTSKWRLSSDKG